MSARIVGRSKAGLRKRRCACCHRAVWYVRRSMRPASVIDHEGVRVDLVADVLLCDACIARNPTARLELVSLEVATADAEEGCERRPRRRCCRVCGGGGCRRCDGRGSVPCD